MRILVIGGTVFVGPAVVRELVVSGHDVAVFHRGEHEIALPDVEHIHGDRGRLGEYRDAIAAFRPDTVVDMRAMTERDAQAALEALRGIAPRIVAISSMDVYRAYGRLHGSEPGPLEPMPLTEDSPLRDRLYPYREHTPASIGQRPPWLDDYDKILVEQAALGDREIVGTVIRFPMVHGERDAQRRFYWLFKRMADRRPAILLSEGEAAFRSSRTYVDNAAHAVVLAATDERAAGRTYNVGEPDTLDTLAWAREIAALTGWRGELVVVPSEQLPAHLRDARPDFYAQHLVADTSRIREELGYAEVVSRTEALRRAIDWYASEPPADPATAAKLDYPAEDAALVTIRASAVH